MDMTTTELDPHMAALAARTAAAFRAEQPAPSCCTCGEPPMSGHYLWCEALRGQPEFKPRTVDRTTSQSHTSGDGP
jgi:hypothetical protein